MPVPTPLLTIDDRGEDSHASKVWVGDCLVKDQTANAAGSHESVTHSNHGTICHHAQWHRSARQPVVVGSEMRFIDGQFQFGRVGVCRWDVHTWVRLFYTVKWLTDGSTCWWPWRWWLAPNQSRAVLWWKGSSWLSAPTGGTWPQRSHTPVGWHSRCILRGRKNTTT